MPRALGDGPSLSLLFVSNPSQGASCGSHLEMMGESLWAPNRSQSSSANPWSPVFPRLLQNLEKCRPPYIPAFISEQGSDGRLCGTGTWMVSRN